MTVMHEKATCQISVLAPPLTSYGISCTNLTELPPGVDPLLPFADTFSSLPHDASSAGDSSCHLSPASFPWNCVYGKQENAPHSKLFASYQLAQPSQRWLCCKPSSDSFATADLKMDTLILKLVTKLVMKPQWSFVKILIASLFLFCRALNKAVLIFFFRMLHIIFS